MKSVEYLFIDINNRSILSCNVTTYYGHKYTLNISLFLVFFGMLSDNIIYIIYLMQYVFDNNYY